MRKYTVLGVLLLSVVGLFGQQLISPLASSDGENYGLQSVKFITKNTGIIEGVNKDYYSHDKGSSWKIIDQSESYKYVMVTESRWFGFNESEMIKTIDGGGTFIQVDHNIDNIIDIKFRDSLFGVLRAEYNNIFYTIDGGESWQKSSNDQMESNYVIENLMDFCFVGDYLFAFTEGNGVYNIYQSTNRAESWEFKNEIDPRGVPGENIYFRDSLTGFILERFGYNNSSVLITRDGGMNWERAGSGSGTFNNNNTWGYNEDFSLPPGILSFIFISDTLAYLLSKNGIYYSENKGESWIILKDFSAPRGDRIDQKFTGIVSFSKYGEDGVVVGCSKGTVFTVSKENGFDYINGGYYSHFRKFLNDGGNKGIFIGNDGVIVRTENGGNSFLHSRIDTGSFFFIDANSVDSMVWVLSKSGKLYHSNDFGDKWELVSDFQRDFEDYSHHDLTYYHNDFFLRDRQDWNKICYGGAIKFIDKTRGYLAFDSLLLYTDDQGVSWDTNYIFQDIIIAEMSFITDSLIFITGNNSKIYRSENRGATWNLVYFSQDVNDFCENIVKVNGDTMYASCENKILWSKNNGKNWSVVDELSWSRKFTKLVKTGDNRIKGHYISTTQASTGYQYVENGSFGYNKSTSSIFKIYDDFNNESWNVKVGGYGLIMCSYTSSCFNGIQDGDETGIDCGGNCELLCDTIVTSSNINGNGIFVFDKTFFLYPNPADDQIILQMESNDYSSLVIRNIKGQLVMHEQINNTEMQLDVSALKPGLYFIELQGKGKSITEKMIIR